MVDPPEHFTGYAGQIVIGEPGQQKVFSPDAPRVLIAGSGLWATSLAQVVRTSRGEPVLSTTLDETVTLLQETSPSVAVVGPPFSEADLDGCLRVLIGSVPHPAGKRQAA